ncbi:MAG: methionyl-tRNA formyltransferase [Cytophagales bacterium]|nr:MAG: methionyl-tRNA formyltransferase [Cytophagales bacterium]TAF61214.1 MAG: methionyl-tRNA formyltransferase [Cytophagales bacterium]
MRIVFFGTPDFAVASLKALLRTQHEVVAVVTAPDKPVKRGNQFEATPIKRFALEHNLLVLQPPKLKAPEFLDTLRSLKPDLQIVVAFRMLPEVVWSMPPLGTINLHASLLPQYRGAAPINWAIINNDTETGVTTFFLKHEIDTGDLLLQDKEPIYTYDDAGSLHDRLMEKGAELVVRTVEGVASNRLSPIPQPQNTELLKAPKLFPETCLLSAQMSAHTMHHYVRGLAPVPAAKVSLSGKLHKLFKTIILNEEETKSFPDLAVGQIYTNHKTIFALKCQDAWLSILEIQAEGKKRLPIKEFLNGALSVKDWKLD